MHEKLYNDMSIFVKLKIALCSSRSCSVLIRAIVIDVNVIGVILLLVPDDGMHLTMSFDKLCNKKPRN